MSKFIKSNPVIIIIALLVISAIITGIVYCIISLIKPKSDPFSNKLVQSPCPSPHHGSNYGNFINCGYPLTI